MKDYYLWEKLAQEDLQARYNEAEADKLANELDGQPSFGTWLLVAVPSLAGLVILFFLLTG